VDGGGHQYVYIVDGKNRTMSKRSHRVCYAVYALQLEPIKETEQFLRSDHPLQKSINIINGEFPTTEEDSGLEVYFAWGVGKVDRSGVNQLTDPEFLGEPRFIDTFAFTEQCQTELLTACSTLRSKVDYQPHIKQENGLGTVSCFVEEFAAFSALGSLADCPSVLDGDWRGQNWQVPIADVPATLNRFLRERSCYSDEGLPVLDQYVNEIGWDGANLRFVAIELESSVLNLLSTLPEDTVRKEYDAMLGIAKDLDRTIGTACGVGSETVVMTDLAQVFIFMNNQSIYESSALQSCLLGIGLAFAVLLVSTRVFHIALFATISITCVLISVTGTMVLIGMKLGTIESVLISIVVGFAVDYVVHLSHSYAEAYGNSDARMLTAFSEMGISVLHGMVTSIGASLPLFLCQLTFFRKFGTFMFLTISFSWLFANFVFMGALAQFRLRVTKHDDDDHDDHAESTNSSAAPPPTTATDRTGSSAPTTTVQAGTATAAMPAATTTAAVTGLDHELEEVTV
jgi:protein dispatched 1